MEKIENGSGDHLQELEREDEVNQSKLEEDKVTKSNGHIHYYTPFDVERKDLKKLDSICSTKVQCSSVDTIYSSREVENTNFSLEGGSIEKIGSRDNDEGTEDVIVEEFEPITGAMEDYVHNVIVTNASVDFPGQVGETGFNKGNLVALAEENNSLDTLDCVESHGLASPAMSACVSPASSNGGIYTVSEIKPFVFRWNL